MAGGRTLCHWGCFSHPLRFSRASHGRADSRSETAAIRNFQGWNCRWLPFSHRNWCAAAALAAPLPTGVWNEPREFRPINFCGCDRCYGDEDGCGCDPETVWLSQGACSEFNHQWSADCGPGVFHAGYTHLDHDVDSLHWRLLPFIAVYLHQRYQRGRSRSAGNESGDESNKCVSTTCFEYWGYGGGFNSAALACISP